MVNKKEIAIAVGISAEIFGYIEKYKVTEAPRGKERNLIVHANWNNPNAFFEVEALRDNKKLILKFFDLVEHAEEHEFVKCKGCGIHMRKFELSGDGYCRNCK